MKKFRMLQMVVGTVAGVCLGAGIAQAAVVTAVSGGTATLSILDTGGNPLADSAFPGPGQIIKLVLTAGGISTPISSLALQPGTSNYQGTCTNFGSTLDVALDFEPVSGTVDQLRSKDCGGKVVVLINNQYTFVFPADSDNDGLPDWWERLSCVTDATCLNPNGDTELLGTNPAQGDGLANFDEYRGFIVNGAPIRTDPKKKDLFVHLLNPQCPSTGLSLLGQRSGETQVIYPTDGTLLLNNLPVLGGASTPVAYHFLTYQARGVNGASPEWLDYLVSYNVANPDFVFAQAPDGSAGRIGDRSINQNALYHPYPNTPVQKGIRLIECLNSLVGAVGVAFFPAGTQVGNPNSDTNSVVYTKRIFNNYAALLNKASSSGGTSKYKTCALNVPTTYPSSPVGCVYYSTYNAATQTWTPGTNTYTDGSGTHYVNRDYIVSKYIQFIVAMELAHAVELISVLQITTYGPHYAPGTGDNLDQRIVAKDSTALKGVLFQIPSSYGDKDNAGFHLHQ